jgi:hypothetical protein
MDPAVLQAIQTARQQVGELTDAYSSRMMKEVVPRHLQRLAPLFEQRQPFFDQMEGFWTAAVLSAESPTNQFCADCDAKILRAIQSVRVTKTATVGESDVVLRLTITLRQNIFCNGGDVHREMKNDGTTVSTAAVQWKVGAQAVKGTILRVFDPATPDAEAKAIVDAYDMLFQNPIEMMK